jgi:hypothetical protein
MSTPTTLQAPVAGETTPEVVPFPDEAPRRPEAQPTPTAAATPLPPQPIEVAYPVDAAPTLHLRLGACSFRLRPASAGQGGSWLRGVYHDPSGSLPLKTSLLEGTLWITQAPSVANFSGLLGAVPTLELELGADRPYALVVESGASECDWELGGLPLTAVTLRLGAGKADVTFSAPPTAPMRTLRADVAAGSLHLHGLGRLGCPDMMVTVGAAAVQLDFDVRPTVATNLTLESGLAGATLSTPAATPVRLKGEMVLGDVNVDPAFVRNEEAWWSPSAMAGERPLLSVLVRGALSGFTLTNGV